MFAESDLVHKIQMGHPREDIIAGVCNAVVANYLSNVGKGKKILSPVVFQGGVSKNEGVVAAFERTLGCKVIVDPNGHLMGALGVAILARKGSGRQKFEGGPGRPVSQERAGIQGAARKIQELRPLTRRKTAAGRAPGPPPQRPGQASGTGRSGCRGRAGTSENTGTAAFNQAQNGPEGVFPPGRPVSVYRTLAPRSQRLPQESMSLSPR